MVRRGHHALRSAGTGDRDLKPAVADATAGPEVSQEEQVTEPPVSPSVADATDDQAPVSSDFPAWAKPMEPDPEPEPEAEITPRVQVNEGDDGQDAGPALRAALEIGAESAPISKAADGCGVEFDGGHAFRMALTSSGETRSAPDKSLCGADLALVLLLSAQQLGAPVRIPLGL